MKPNYRVIDERSYQLIIKSLNETLDFCEKAVPYESDQADEEKTNTYPGATGMAKWVMRSVLSTLHSSEASYKTSYSDETRYIELPF